MLCLQIILFLQRWIEILIHKSREIELKIGGERERAKKKPFPNDVYNYNKCYLEVFFRMTFSHATHLNGVESFQIQH